MQKYKMTRLAAYLTLAVGLAACGANGGDGSGDGGDGGGGGGGGGTPDVSELCAIPELGPVLAELLGASCTDGGGTGGNTSNGLIDELEALLTEQLAPGTPIEPLAELLAGLINAENGDLSALTGPLNDLTALDGGALGPLTELIQQLATSDDAALAPVVGTLNTILGGLEAGQDPTDIISTLEGLLTGTGGGGSTDEAGLITSVQTIVEGVVGDTALSPVDDLVNTLLDPSSGSLEALTSQLEAVTADPDGLGQLTEIVNQLIAADDAALAPLVTTLNSILGGLEAGQDPTTIISSLEALLGSFSGGTGSGDLPIIGDLLGLLGGGLPL